MVSKGAISPQPWGKWGILLVQPNFLLLYYGDFLCLCRSVGGSLTPAAALPESR